MKSVLVLGVTGFAGLIAINPVSASGLDVYLSAPTDVTSQYSNITVETFDSPSLPVATYTTPYVGAFGTYQASTTSKMAILNDDQYGSGTSHYMSIGAQSGTSGPLTLKLTSAVSYFGFSWNAGDANNGVTFYNGNQLIGRFSTQDVMTLLSAPTITAVNGTTYNSADYKGKWNGGSTKTQNTSEPYAFINFIDTAGVFDKVVFDNSGSTGTGFETDNHTIRVSAPAAKGSFVHVGVVTVPEPTSLLLLALACPVGLVRVHRRK